ncbi:hypothetical protein F8M41_003412 [Gigaspora margarita]|uniref:Uncharacterized protein n=1 Tax=Gigaspora margarita TaxID=4874 RepID=A0A8H4EV90_GIGMA|nr:hypothetical protein F8M41_003412 [Gigaspora margarita]
MLHRVIEKLRTYHFILNIQRKYLKIVAEGWDNKPEKRIRMDEILLKFLDIEAELNNKFKKNNLESVGRSTRNLHKSISDNRRHLLRSPNSISDSKRYSPQSPILFPITDDIHFSRTILFLNISDIHFS